MELITVNIAGGVRRERLHGRDYLVAPVSMVVPGVLNGSKGPLLYELADLQATYDAWNGMPIVCNHPVDENGQAISARTPKVLEERWMGHVYNTKAIDKLAAEAWFDVERTRTIHGPTLNALQNNQKVEVSTGLNLDQEPTQGVYNAANGTPKPYVAIARNYRPDHLAIITEGKGACSTDDGCGVNNEDGQAGKLQKVFDLLKPIFGGSKAPTDPPPTNNQEPNKMGLTAEQRTMIITALTTNCACWKDKKAELEKADDGILTALNTGLDNEKKLKDTADKLAAVEPIANAAKAGFAVGDGKVTINEKGEWVQEAKKVDAPPVVNSDKKEPLKMEDLPAEIQADITFARNIRMREKKSLIDKIVGNAANADAARKVYEGMSTDQLKALLPKAPEFTPATNEADFDWSGAGVGQFDAVTNQDKPEPLGQLDWNFTPEGVTVTR